MLRPDVARWPRRALIGVVRAYRLLLSPWLGQSCRFTPTCSVYAIEALERHGAIAGSAWAGWRLLRCHPWCEGGADPVPGHAPWRGRRAASPHPVRGMFSELLRESGPDTSATASDAVPTTSKTPDPSP